MLKQGLKKSRDFLFFKEISIMVLMKGVFMTTKKLAFIQVIIALIIAVVAIVGYLIGSGKGNRFNYHDGI